MFQFQGKQLFFAERLVTEGRVIIVDVEFDEDQVLAFWALPDMILLFPDQLAIALGEIMENELADDNIKTLVFPGNGGQMMRNLLPVRGFAQTNVAAKRVWEQGQNPTAVVGQIDDRRFLIMDDQVVVLDNVINSGVTLRLTYERNVWRTPRATWIAGCLISQTPRKTYPIGLFGSIFTALLVENPNGLRVPINSLSTLVENDEIMHDYSRRSGYRTKLIEIAQAWRKKNQGGLLGRPSLILQF